MPSDAGAQLFHRRLSASAVCQMHRDSGRACNRNGGIPFPGCLFTEFDWNYSAYDRWNRAAVHILRIDERSAVIHRNTVWVWDDERLHPYGSANCYGFVFVMGMCDHARYKHHVVTRIGTRVKLIGQPAENIEILDDFRNK